MTATQQVDAVIDRIQQAGQASIDEIAQFVMEAFDMRDERGGFRRGWNDTRAGEAIVTVLTEADRRGFTMVTNAAGAPARIEATIASAADVGSSGLRWDSDGGHEWLRVPLREYPDAGRFATGYGYIDAAAGVIYLEGDVEALSFLAAHPTVAANSIPTVEYTSDAPCRSLPHNTAPREPHLPPAPAETMRAQRGHDFYPPAEALGAIPATSATDGVRAGDKLAHLHYFAGDWDWYVLELDPDSREAFTFVTSPMCPEGELGYSDLNELEAMVARVPVRINGEVAGNAPLVVERDLDWTPRQLREVAPRLDQPRPTHAPAPTMPNAPSPALDGLT